MTVKIEGIDPENLSSTLEGGSGINEYLTTPNPTIADGFFEVRNRLEIY